MLANYPACRGDGFALCVAHMKKLLLCSIVAAFACASVQAGDDKAKACPAAAKTACESACSAKKLTKKADSTAKGATQLLAKR